MKKGPSKRGRGYRHAELMKPFGFCCEITHQDPDTRYNMRIPPMVTSLTNIAPKSTDGPDLKFRLQDVAKVTSPVLRSGTKKVKSATRVGTARGTTRGRGPLQWYIEDEIALARELIASEKEEKRNREKKLKLMKAKKKRKRSKSKGRGKGKSKLKGEESGENKSKSPGDSKESTEKIKSSRSHLDNTDIHEETEEKNDHSKRVSNDEE